MHVKETLKNWGAQASKKENILLTVLTIPDFNTILTILTEIFKHKLFFPIAAAG